MSHAPGRPVLGSGYSFLLIYGFSEQYMAKFAAVSWSTLSSSSSPESLHLLLSRAVRARRYRLTSKVFNIRFWIEALSKISSFGRGSRVGPGGLVIPKIEHLKFWWQPSFYCYFSVIIIILYSLSLLFLYDHFEKWPFQSCI